MTTPRRMAAVLAVAALGLAGCSSDEPDASNTSNTADTGETGPTTPMSPGFEDVPECPATGATADELATAVPADDGPEGTLLIREDRNTHVQTCVEYDVRPPVGGDHYARWANCGFYRQRVPTQLAVHAMEHGAVWITFDPALPAADQDAIKAAVVGRSHVLASPFDGLSHPVVLTAWSRQLSLDSVADPRLAEFIDAYEEGPQTLEPGARCDGADGTPEP